MLDINGLPKNSNGVRTTHTCELCGFEPKTKNKYREKQDHLVMKHFKDRIDKIFPHCRPYTCPNPDCDFTGKDKQALLRHYTGKHGVLELYLREALAEKGIQYNISDSAKRKSMSQSDRKAKEARLSPPATTTQITNIQVSPPVMTNLNMTAAVAPVVTSPLTSTLTIPPAALNSTGATTFPTIAISTNNHHQMQHQQPQHRLQQPQQHHQQHHQTMMADTTTPLGSDLSEIVYTSTVTRLPTVPTTKLPSMSTVLRPFTSHGKCDVDALLASFQPIDTQLVVNLPSPTDLPLDSPLVSSTTPDFFLPEEPNKLVLNDNIMWGSGTLPFSEPAQTVPVNYLDAGSDLASLGDLDYDYLNPATTMEPQSVLAVSNSERHLSFSML